MPEGFRFAAHVCLPTVPWYRCARTSEEKEEAEAVLCSANMLTVSRTGAWPANDTNPKLQTKNRPRMDQIRPDQR